jgi:arylsulfatase A-like enzyme
MRRAPAAPPRRSRAVRAAALAALAAAGCARAEPAPRGPDLVLVTLESLRTDRVGAQGGASAGRSDLSPTPHLDEFAAGATLYPDAHSVTSWTLAAHASLFTGLYPSGHQTTGALDRLDDSYPTLAEALAERGYQTAAVVSGPYLRRTHNLSQGFELYDDSIASITSRLAHDDVTSPAMLESLRRFLDEQRDPRRPFFLFAYFWDPHYDYLPPPPWDTAFVPPGAEPFDARGFDTNAAIHAGMDARRLDWLRAQYEGEIRWTDEHLGRLFALLRERGLFDAALVAVTADHGEEFFDHGEKGHKNNLYAETVHVPLIVKYPGQREARRDPRLASLVDVLPTLLEAAGAAAPFPVDGRSLREPQPDPARAVLYELETSRYYGAAGGSVSARHGRWRALRRGEVKLVEREVEGEGGVARRLFRVGSDPTERDDLAAGEPERVAELARELEAAVARAQAGAEGRRRGGEAELTEAERAQLEALGYFERRAAP